jgi:hypothetical protein
MKITNQLFALFVTQQVLSASAFAPKNVAFKNTALNYQVNESEKFQQENLVNHDLKDLKKVANVVAPKKNNAQPIAQQQQPKPEIGGSKKFDLSAAKKARVVRHTGAVRGAFKSLAGTHSVKSIQGGKCLKTWNISSDKVDRVSVMINNEGVPLSASVEVWQGPNSTPMRLQIASDDGNTYPFSAVLETPNKHNSIAVRNMSPMEFPMGACVVADVEDVRAGGNKQAGQGAVVQALADLGESYKVDGDNGVESFQFENTVESIQILLQTDGRPLHARVELVQGTNDNKQVVDIFSENGLDQPFFAVIDTPSMFDMSAGATVRIVNTAPSTVFPLSAIVEPYMVSDSYVPPVKPETKVDISNDLFFLSTDDDVEQI